MALDKLVNKLESLEKERQAQQEQESKETQTRLPRHEIKVPGMRRFRLFPNKLDAEDIPWYEIFLHFFMHPNYERKFPFVCLRNPCPLCKVYLAKKDKGVENAFKYRANNQFLYYALDDKGVFGFLTLTWLAQQAMEKAILKHAKNGLNVTDLNQGYWVEIGFKMIPDGNTEKRRWSASAELTADKVSADNRLLYNNQKPLSKLYQPLSFEDLQKVAKGEKFDMGGGPATEHVPTKDELQTSNTNYRKLSDITDDKNKK